MRVELSCTSAASAFLDRAPGLRVTHSMRGRLALWPAQAHGCSEVIRLAKNPQGYRIIASAPRVLSSTRRTSATLQACATQPRGTYGASASKISLIDPTQASFR